MMPSIKLTAKNVLLASRVESRKLHEESRSPINPGPTVRQSVAAAIPGRGFGMSCKEGKLLAIYYCIWFYFDSQAWGEDVFYLICHDQGGFCYCPCCLHIIRRGVARRMGKGPHLLVVFLQRTQGLSQSGSCLAWGQMICVPSSNFFLLLFGWEFDNSTLSSSQVSSYELLNE